jgi:Prp8 binding protein
MAPNMLLTGHKGHIHGAKFSHEGNFIASGGFDKTVLLWNTYGVCENWGMLKGHEQSVVDLCWNRDDDLIFTASADKTAAAWDVNTMEKVKRMRNHKGVVNSICAARRGEPIVVTGSDDCTAMIWDLRVRNNVQAITCDYQCTAVALSDDSSQLFTGGIDNVVKCWDLVAGKMKYALEGHRDTITGLKLSPDGKHLLSNSMDETLRSWDVSPYVSNTRLVNTFVGATHDLQKWLLKCSWSHDGKRVSCGSADNFVYVWDALSGQIQYKLPGHKACVMEVDFHPKEPVIVSCSQDKQIFVGEIEA